MVSVIIPALNEAARVAGVVRLARQSPLVEEVLVVDDGSIDGTPEVARAAGARVITSTLLGKGASMADGLRATRSPLLLFLDGDLDGLRAGLVETMVQPLLAQEADFVKARFSRASGRVTMLTARPLLELFFPELASLEQPLGGVVAARRSLLERLRFETDYGVDLGLLIDAAACGGRVCEVSIGHLEHEPQTLAELSGMARQVVRTLLDRAQRYGRFNESWRDRDERQREESAGPAELLDPLRGSPAIVLFEMDGTLIQGRFLDALARETGRSRALQPWLENPRISPEERCGRIARALAGVPRAAFESVARQVPLTPGAAETIVALRRAGFRAGVIGERFRIAAETIRRRVFGDFSVGHLLRFQAGKSTGEVVLTPLLRHPAGCRRHWHCPRNLVLHLRDRLSLGAEHLLAVANDECLLSACGRAIAYEPQSLWVASTAHGNVFGDLRPVLGHMLALTPAGATA